jgi:hypothetical protein
MNGKMFTRGAMLAAIALLAAAPGPATAGDPIADMLAGKSATKGKKLDYLATLRCANGQPPQFNRIGNYGIGVFGNIIDGYDVRCEGSEPAKTTVFMDMYHAGHVETRPVPGFTIGAN